MRMPGQSFVSQKRSFILLNYGDLRNFTGTNLYDKNYYLYPQHYLYPIASTSKQCSFHGSNLSFFVNVNGYASTSEQFTAIDLNDRTPTNHFQSLLIPRCQLCGAAPPQRHCSILRQSYIATTPMLTQRPLSNNPARRSAITNISPIICANALRVAAVAAVAAVAVALMVCFSHTLRCRRRRHRLQSNDIRNEYGTHM